MQRPRHGSMKLIKRWIAAGDLHTAEQALLSIRDGLLMELRKDHDEETRQLIEYRLTLVSIKLGVVASLKRQYDGATKWFNRARKYYVGFDPVMRERMNREEAMHLLRAGEAREALRLISPAERTLRTITKFRQSELPEARLELEEAITLSCKAEIELELNPSSLEAIQELRNAQPVLRAGNKRRYELDNLLRLIRHTGTLDPRRPGYIARAMRINETKVRNPDIRLELLDTICGPFPLRPVIHRFGRTKV